VYDSELPYEAYTDRPVKGVYGDKTATLERFKENYRTKLSDEIRERLVFENDEVCSFQFLPISTLTALRGLLQR